MGDSDVRGASSWGADGAASVEDIDLQAGIIHVRRGWDYKEGEISHKSGKDRRVPIPAALRVHLAGTC